MQRKKNLKLVYRRNKSADVLIGYSDSNWGVDKNDYKSTSGNTVSWISRKQHTVSLSSTEAEYIAVTEAVCEAKWLRSLLNEMGTECVEPTVI